MAAYGFDRLVYGFTRYKSDTSLGDPNDFIVLSNHDPKYIQGSMDEGWYFHSPMLHWALEHEGAGSWRSVAHMKDSQTLTAQEQRVHDFNPKMGGRGGL